MDKAKNLSSDEDTESQYPMSDQELTGDDDAQCQTLNQFVVHPNDPTDAIPVTNPTYDINMTILSPSATTNSKSQMTKHTHNVSPATTSYYLQSGPHSIKLRQILPRRDSLESPMPSNRRLTNIFQPYDLPDKPPRPVIPNYRTSIHLCRISNNN